MNKEIHLAFQTALEAMERGASIESALATHPQFAKELTPLLETAVTAITAKSKLTPNPESKERSRARMIHYAARQRNNTNPQVPIWKRWRFVYASLAVAVFLIITGTGIWVASAQALPGDSLYVLKLRAEEINLSLTNNKASRQSLQTQYRQRRVDEVQKLLETGRIESIAFEGVLRLQGDDAWDVERILVRLDENTSFLGPFSLGDDIEIHGVTSEEGSVLASMIALRRYHLINHIQAQNGDLWVIADRQIDVSDALISPGIVLGSLVEVEVEVSGENIHKALLIRHFQLAVTPSPSEIDLEATKETHDDSETYTEVEFEGLLESMNTSIVIVNGRVFHLTDETEFEGILTPGVRVTVEAVEANDGTLTAISIRIYEADENKPGDSTEPKDGDDKTESAEGNEEVDEPDDDDDPEEEKDSKDDD